MQTSRTRKLEDEFEQIVREHRGDMAGRREADEYLSQTHALYHGDPTPWALTPKIFDAETTAVLKDAAELMYGIMDKVTRAFCADPAVRARFDLDPAFAELCAMDAGYDCQIPLARVDIFLDEDTGAYKFCELNTDGSAGMVVTDAVDRAVRMTPSFQEFERQHPGLRDYALCDGWVDALFETYAEWSAAHPGRTEDGVGSNVDVDRCLDGWSRVEANRTVESPVLATKNTMTGVDAPSDGVSCVAENAAKTADANTAGAAVLPASVAIVDYAESIDREDAAHFVELMRRRGVAARFADVRDLWIGEDENGMRRLCDAEGPIDCVWRRAVTGELWDKPCDGRAALIEAARDGLACIVGGFRTWPCATKTVFAYLWSPAARELLTPEEIAFVREHVPYTEMLGDGSDLGRFASKDRWIIKPSGGYNAVGVVAGLDAAEDEWAQLLAQAAHGGAIIQEYAPQYKTPCLRGTLVDGPHRGAAPEGLADELGFAPAANMEGLYLYRGRFAGVYTRVGFGNTIGEWTSRLNVASFFEDVDR